MLLLRADAALPLAHAAAAAQLEAVVSRLKLLAALPSLAGAALGRLRFCAVSATIPNVADVGAWLGAPPGHAPAFGDEYRACALDVKGARAKGPLGGPLLRGACVSPPGADVARCARSARLQPRQERLSVRAVRRSAAQPPRSCGSQQRPLGAPPPPCAPFAAAT